MPEDTGNQPDADFSFENEELMQAVQKMADDYMTKYESQRSDMDDLWEVLDYMTKAAQNSTIVASEKSKGMNLPDDTELANTGSTLAHTVYRRLAALGVSVQSSRSLPFKFSPVINEQVFDSPEDAVEQAASYNTLARWTMKQDKFDIKSILFWHDLKKYGNIPVWMEHRRRVKEIRNTEPVYETRETPEGPVNVEIGKREVIEEVVVENYPSLRILRIDQVYADYYIGNLADQDCVIIVNPISKAEIWQGVADGIYDEDQARKIARKEKWDGETRKGTRTARKENTGEEEPELVTDLYLAHDVFMRCPIKDGKWNESEPEEFPLRWFTVVGNSIKQGVMIGMNENPDPSGEMPGEMIHALPEEGDILYHTAELQIVRSNYSTECTLKNLALDNGGLINRPPLKEVEGEVRGTDRDFAPARKFLVERPESLSEFDVHDTTMQTVNLLNWVKEDTMQALVADPGLMGQAFGGRTSSQEAGNIHRASIQPHLILIRYVLNQFLGWYAKKLISWWPAIAVPGQICAITDSEFRGAVQPADLHGEFDIEIDIVDDFEEDLVASQRVDEALTVISNSPQLAQFVDIPKLVTEWFRRKKFPNYYELAQKPPDEDAREIARQEHIALFQNGIAPTVKPGENLEVHLSEHERERLRYKGIEDAYPQVQILDQHILETKAAVEAKMAPQGRPAPAMSGNQTEGQVGGNAIAGMLGKLFGGNR